VKNTDSARRLRAFRFLLPASCFLLLCCLSSACRQPSRAAQDPPSATVARNIVIITIDTLRADRVGAYGYAAARTPAIDRLAREGVMFGQAFATAPITLTSHASLMTGRYPPGHGARHNGVRLDERTPTLAATLSGAGFATGGFIAAFPLDRRFGLARGFDVYGDRMPPGVDGRAVNERPGRQVVDEALAWLARNRSRRFFLWVHLFEPHAPYGTPSDAGRDIKARYDDEIAEADAQAGRILEALGSDRAATLVVFAGDHGEAFGEHGEIGHSIFLYDTTLRVPLVIAATGLPAGRNVREPVSLIDVAPTVLRLLGLPPLDSDGIDLGPALQGAAVPARELYAETFAPLLDFGWSPLRALRAAGWKYIAAPRPELYDVAGDPAENVDTIKTQGARAAALQDRVAHYSAPEPAIQAAADPDTRARLQALGYASRSSTPGGGSRPDPKDRREEAARIAQVTSGEVQGAALERTLRSILADDPGNPQAHLRLGYALVETGRCAEAAPHFRTAIAAHFPSADAHLGLAGCETSARRFDRAAATLRDAERLEPGNPVVLANLGLVLSDGGHPAEAIQPLQKALSVDPDLHQARFALAIAWARTGQRAQAASTARELLQRLPPTAPQRPEVERLLRSVE
jgi:arylsulfatase A-like enzyme/cytochrome c-type biogenesis protein CcmH/NrfG